LNEHTLLTCVKSEHSPPEESAFSPCLLHTFLDFVLVGMAGDVCFLSGKSTLSFEVSD
jgi:hypothetical protein